MVDERWMRGGFFIERMLPAALGAWSAEAKWTQDLFERPFRVCYHNAEGCACCGANGRTRNGSTLRLKASAVVGVEAIQRIFFNELNSFENEKTF